MVGLGWCMVSSYAQLPLQHDQLGSDVQTQWISRVCWKIVSNTQKKKDIWESHHAIAVPTPSFRAMSDLNRKTIRRCQRFGEPWESGYRTNQDEDVLWCFVIYNQELGKYRKIYSSGCHVWIIYRMKIILWRGNGKVAICGIVRLFGEVHVHVKHQNALGRLLSWWLQSSHALTRWISTDFLGGSNRRPLLVRYGQPTGCFFPRNNESSGPSQNHLYQM